MTQLIGLTPEAEQRLATGLGITISKPRVATAPPKRARKPRSEATAASGALILAISDGVISAALGWELSSAGGGNVILMNSDGPTGDGVPVINQLFSKVKDSTLVWVQKTGDDYYVVKPDCVVAHAGSGTGTDTGS